MHKVCKWQSQLLRDITFTAAPTELKAAWMLGLRADFTLSQRGRALQLSSVVPLARNTPPGFFYVCAIKVDLLDVAAAVAEQVEFSAIGQDGLGAVVQDIVMVLQYRALAGLGVGDFLEQLAVGVVAQLDTGGLITGADPLSYCVVGKPVAGADEVRLTGCVLALQSDFGQQSAGLVALVARAG